MKSILFGIIAALGLAIVAAVVLDTEFQRSVQEHFRTEAVRL